MIRVITARIPTLKIRFKYDIVRKNQKQRGIDSYSKEEIINVDDPSNDSSIALSSQENIQKKTSYLPHPVLQIERKRI